jgi:hypothetical protein
MRWVAAVWLMVGMWMAAQAPEKEPALNPGTLGTVTGRLTFAETQLPARFAEVVLVRKPDPGDLTPDWEDGPPSRAQLEAQRKRPPKVVSLSGRSGLDGSYTIADVPAGDYWAIARMPGYVVPIGSPATAAEAREIDKLTAALPVVHVNANQVATADVALRRGGVIAGRVTFKDGSPAVGAAVRVESAEAGDLPHQIAYMPLVNVMANRNRLVDAGGGMLSEATDDEGRYRLSGLTPGRYRVSVSLAAATGMRMVMEKGGMSGRPVGRDSSLLTVYLPNAVRREQGKVVEIRGDEQFLDADLEVDLDGLHTVRGKVLAQEDRHVPSFAYLMLKEDGTKGLGKQASIEADGTFRFDYVPPGTYTLGVMYAQDVEETSQEKLEQMSRDPDVGYATHPKVVKKYARMRVAVLVGEHDVALDDVLLVEAKGKQAEEDEQP